MFLNNLKIEYILKFKKQLLRKKINFSEIENEKSIIEDIKKEFKEKNKKNFKNIEIFKKVSTNLNEDSIFKKRKEIFENDIVYSKSLDDIAIVEWHNVIGAWTVLFEDIGSDKLLFLYTEKENDIYIIGDIYDINLETISEKQLKNKIKKIINN